MELRRAVATDCLASLVRTGSLQPRKANMLVFKGQVHTQTHTHTHTHTHNCLYAYPLASPGHPPAAFNLVYVYPTNVVAYIAWVPDGTGRGNGTVEDAHTHPEVCI